MTTDTDWLQLISPYMRPSKLKVPLGRGPRWTFGREKPANWTQPRRIITDHELIIVSAGRFNVTIEDQSYDCPAGTFIIIPPGKWSTKSEAEGRKGFFYWSHFNWTQPNPYPFHNTIYRYPNRPDDSVCQYAPDFVPKTVFHGTIQSPLHAYDRAEKLVAAHTSEVPRTRAVGRALLLELLLYLLDSSDTTEKYQGKTQDLARRVKDLLDAHSRRRNTFKLQQILTEQLDKSYAHLCRLFHLRYGVPPLKYMNQTAMREARQMLAETDLPVKDIARKLGFEDAPYFSQLFRRTTGMTPSRYRAAGGRDRELFA